jgi:hypothetical protein
MHAVGDLSKGVKYLSVTTRRAQITTGRVRCAALVSDDQRTSN